MALVSLQLYTYVLEKARNEQKGPGNGQLIRISWLETNLYNLKGEVGDGGVCGGIVGGRVCFVWYAFFTIKKCMSTLLLFYWVTLLFLNFFFRGTIGTIHAMRLSRSFEVTFYLYQVTPIFMPSETYTHTK